MNTGITLPLEKMSVAEKLEMIELIWADLVKKPESIPSPSWHGEHLSNVEEGLADGTDHFFEWEEAKRSIDKRTS